MNVSTIVCLLRVVPLIPLDRFSRKLVFRVILGRGECFDIIYFVQCGQRVYLTTEGARARTLSPPPIALFPFFSLRGDDVLFVTTLRWHAKKLRTEYNNKKFQRHEQCKAVEGHPNTYIYIFIYPLYSSDGLSRLYIVRLNNWRKHALRKIIGYFRIKTRFSRTEQTFIFTSIKYIKFSIQLLQPLYSV